MSVKNSAMTTESVVVRDAGDYSKIVTVVIRDFCPVEGVIDWVNTVIEENVDERRNVRVRVFPLSSKHELTQMLLAARGFWPFVSDWVHFRCNKQSESWLGTEPPSKTTPRSS